MVQVTIDIKDDCKAPDVLRFLRDIDFLEVHEPVRDAGDAAGKTWSGFDGLIGCVKERLNGAERHDGYLAGGESA